MFVYLIFSIDLTIQLSTIIKINPKAMKCQTLLFYGNPSLLSWESIASIPNRSRNPFVCSPRYIYVNFHVVEYYQI